MEQYAYLTVNGAEGYKNIATWLNKPRKEQKLYDDGKVRSQADVTVMIQNIVEEVKTIEAVPSVDTEWVQVASIVDPYLAEAKAGTLTIVLNNGGDVSAIAQYENLDNKDEPYTYLGYNGSAGGMMNYMANINYTAQPVDMEDEASLNSINLEVELPKGKLVELPLQP